MRGREGRYIIIHVREGGMEGGRGRNGGREGGEGMYIGGSIV